MAYTKDLGNVKGEDGDIYLPEISINNGYLYFKWVKTPADEIENVLTTEKRLNIPVYVPNTMTNDGDLTFTLTQTVRDINGTPLPNKTFHVKGDKGDTGNTAFRIQHVSENNVDQIPVANRRTDTIYVKNTKAWIYDDIEEAFFMLEGIDLSNYYKKTETYSQTEIDEMFNEITSQTELAYKLLDIENIIL